MFTTIKAVLKIPVAIAIVAKEERAYRKESRIRQADEKRYDEMIAQSQAKIGPYIPQPCPVQIWA